MNNDINWYPVDEKPYDNYLKSRWNPSTLEEFKEAIFQDTKYVSGFNTFLNDFEKKLSEEAINNNVTNYNMDSFKYYINDFGFRGANQPLINSDNLIGFFGCSFTFGVGVPEEKHFSKLVCDKLNLTPINFGVPGGSASLVSRIFSTITRFQKLKYAIVMLPNNSRIEYPIEQKDKSTIMTNLLVSFKHYKEEEEALRERLSNVLSHRYMAYTTARSINTIELAAKLAGIHVFYTSWDIPVYNLITSYFKDDKEKIAPWFKFIEKDNYSTYKKGRDGRHPGDYSNKVFADRLCVFLDNKLKINKSLEK